MGICATGGTTFSSAFFSCSNDSCVSSCMKNVEPEIKVIEKEMIHALETRAENKIKELITDHNNISLKIDQNK
jgi:aspartate carbamoyltransferase regulatory subunit